jgi:hypothetical protein
MNVVAATGASPEMVGIPLIIGGVFCLLGLVFFTIGRVRTMMCRSWVASTGLIVNRKGGTEGWPARYPTFGWTGPDGHVYRKTSSVHGGLYRLGSQVPILIDPAQPHRAIMDTFVQKGTIFTVIGSAMGGVGLFMLALTCYLTMNQ